VYMKLTKLYEVRRILLLETAFKYLGNHSKLEKKQNHPEFLLIHA